MCVDCIKDKQNTLRNEPQEIQSFLNYKKIVDPLTFNLLEMKSNQLPLLMIIHIIVMYIYCMKVSILDTLQVFKIKVEGH